MEKYQDIADEELIQLAHGGNNEVVDFLMEKYKNFVRKKAHAMFLLGGDTDDLIQEGMIGLFKAVRDYKLDKDASFLTFADLCISRQIYSAVQASKRKKHIPLNNYISLYSTINEDGEQSSLLSSLRSSKNSNPEEVVIAQENLDNMEEQLNNHLSSLEKEILNLYLAGIRYSQIAELLHRTPKSVDNALQRIKIKLSSLLQEEE